MPGIPRRLRQLDEQLAALPEASDPMLISEFDGFLAGIHVCPDLILPSEWLSMVWGGLDPGAERLFEDIAQIEALTEPIMEHYNAIARDLQRGRYAPVFDVDPRHDDFLWEFWIGGFEMAMRLRPQCWLELLEGDEDTRNAFAGLVMLGEIGRDESSLPESEIEMLSQNAPDLLVRWVETLNALTFQLDPSMGAGQRTSRRTLKPRRKSAATQCDPTKPVPPVTKMCNLGSCYLPNYHGLAETIAIEPDGDIARSRKTRNASFPFVDHTKRQIDSNAAAATTSARAIVIGCRRKVLQRVGPGGGGSRVRSSSLAFRRASSKRRLSSPRAIAQR